MRIRCARLFEIDHLSVLKVEQRLRCRRVKPVGNLRSDRQRKEGVTPLRNRMGGCGKGVRDGLRARRIPRQYEDVRSGLRDHCTLVDKSLDQIKVTDRMRKIGKYT